MALFNGVHAGNTAAAVTAEGITPAPGEICAKALQAASSVSCPGRTVGLVGMLGTFVRSGE